MSERRTFCKRALKAIETYSIHTIDEAERLVIEDRVKFVCFSLFELFYTQGVFKGKRAGVVAESNNRDLGEGLVKWRAVSDRA